MPVVAKAAEVARGGMTRRHGTSHAHHVSRARLREMMLFMAERLQRHGIVELKGIDRHAARGVERAAEATHAWHAHAHADAGRTGSERRRGRRPGGAMSGRRENASAGLRHGAWLRNILRAGEAKGLR